jgi:parvulin-like peptidyl-prolyl isomerase
VAIVIAAVLAPAWMSMAADVIDGVMAIVNDKVITFSEVMALVQPVDRELRRNFSGTELEEQRRKAQADALNSLIERALIVQEFNTKGYKIPDTVVDQQINDIISKEYGGNRAAFVKTLEAENLTLSQFRDQERERVIIQVMRNHKAQQTIIVSPYKIEKHYQENIDQFKVGDQIKLRMIFIKRGEPVATGTVAAEPASSASTNQPAQTNAEASVAATNSEPGATATNVEASVTTSNAEASVATTNSEARATTAPPAVDLQRRLAEEILAKLDAGDSFESMARVYSEGKEAKEGGDWGWIGHDVLRKELNETAFSLKPGQHSRIIETAEGYYILDVDDVKTAHTTPLAEVRDDIEKTLLQEQRAKMQEDWVKDLRAKAYIRVF